MTNHDRELRPHGFGGYRQNWESLLPAGPRLNVPATGRIEAGMLRWPEGGPEGGWQVITIDPLTESMGKVEGVLVGAADRLCAGGSLLLEVENLHSPRSLRRVLEGRVGPCDPVGSLSDPTQYVMPSRALAAVEAAGLWIRDAIRVPSHPHELHSGFVKDMFHAGMLPVTHAGGIPPWKFWIHAEKVAKRPVGTALIGPGTAAEQARTRSTLEAILPTDWDVVCAASDAGNEATAINRAVAETQGHQLWFLRAGATVDQTIFQRLLAETVRGAAVPMGRDGFCDGDLSGLMLRRVTMLQVGPLREDFNNLQIAAEEFLLRLQVEQLEVLPVAEGQHHAPAMRVHDVESFKSEGARLMEVWETFQNPSIPEPVTGTRAIAPEDREVEPPWAGREPTVTLCMIAKNEEQFIGQCLTQAKECVDEIVVLDTGSTDQTVAIAESHGARVEHFDWCDDFAAARNAALQYVTSDWVLVLDADEMLSPGSGPIIRELIRKVGISGYHMRFVNNYTNGTSLGVMMVRLFRNLDGIQYENRIHEQVTPSLGKLGDPLGLTLADSRLEVVHEGYREEVMECRNKGERNERLFRLQLAEHPDDAYSLYKFGDFLRSMPDRDDEALAVLEQCLQTILDRPPVATRTMPFAAEVAALVALAHLQHKRVEAARSVLDIALRRCLATPNLHYIAAGLALTEHRNDEAIAHFRSCLAYRGQTLVVPIQEGITGHVSVAGIAQAYMQKGDLEAARRLLQQAIAMEPGWEVSHLTLARLFLEEGDISRALGVLTDHLRVHPESAGAAQQATLLLQRMGQIQPARAMGQHALRLYRERQQQREAKNVERVLASLG